MCSVEADNFVIAGQDISARSVLGLWTSLSGVTADDLVVTSQNVAAGVLGLWSGWGGVRADNFIVAGQEIEVLGAISEVSWAIDDQRVHTSPLPDLVKPYPPRAVESSNPLLLDASLRMALLTGGLTRDIFDDYSG